MKCKISEEILRYEEAVLFIIQDYLNKNRYFTIHEITPFINSRLRELSINLNYSGIKEVLKSLIKKKLVFERSKLTKPNILNNENREIIYEYIRKNPGIYFNQIAKALKLSNYILGWHLKILLKFNLIRSKGINNHEVFFDINLSNENDDLYYLSSKKKTKRILNFLIENPEGATKTRLSRELNIHSTTISKYTKKLEKTNLILKKRTANKMIYFLNEQFYYSIFNH